jgi:two-component system, chemotaxis family, CheB/CheR fusion protein
MAVVEDDGVAAKSKPSHKSRAAKKGRPASQTSTKAKAPARLPTASSRSTELEIPLPLSSASFEPPGCPIVAIGASAGGLEALEALFRHLPPASGLAFLVVSHQPAGHVSLLPGLLSKCTAMPVVEAVDGMSVQPDHVYLAPGGTNLAMLHGILHLMEPDAEDRVPLPIDYCFRSLAEDQKQRAIGVILSGTGTDGTLGLRAIHAESGMTMVQDPQTAKYQGMPRSAIAAGVVDVVQPPDRMSEPLRAYACSLSKPVQPLPDSDATQTLHKIFILLRDRTGNDFALYKESTILRRIERRMHVHQIEHLRQYVQFVRANPHELDALFQELLIGVTSFFRDPQAFEALLQKALPALVENKSEGATLRAWVAGCSTGEEAYSLAMLLKEYLTQRKLRLNVQIFASDVDTRAIDQARAGLYPVGIAGDLSPERLQRFFTKEDSSYRVKKEIRDLVVFATHNLLTDAPFTKLDLLCCRNVLIYLEAKAQHKILQTFHYALKPDGILFLGTSETIGAFEHLFDSIDRKSKLFKRTAETAMLPSLEAFPGRPSRLAVALPPEIEPVEAPSRRASMPEQIQQLLVSRYAPAAVLVDRRGEILYIHGHTGEFLQPPPGPPTHHLVDMAREGLRQDLATALHQAAHTDDEVVRRRVPVMVDGSVQLVDLCVKKIVEPEALQGLRLVTFERVRESGEASLRKAKAAAPTARMKKGESALQQELAYMKQRLQQTIEELHTSNEELKSSNEELQSTNEELQSTNEELETAKEEMQSLNEELITVNAELQGKLDALTDANDDLQNLLNSTEIATIFLDNDLRIKRFTMEAKRVSHLIASDVGRPLSDIVSKLADDRLLDEAESVLATLVPKEREVQATDGSWFFLRMLPYRTAKNAIDGLVLTFQDITKMKQAEQAIQDSRAVAASIVETVREPLLVLDAQLRVVLANHSFYEMFRVTPREVEQQLLYHLCEGAWNVAELRRLLEDILPKNASFRDFAMEKVFPHVGRKVLLINARRLEQETVQPGRILLAVGDMTGQAQDGTSGARPSGEPPPGR